MQTPLLIALLTSQVLAAKKAEVGRDHRQVVFYLQDEADGLCLGPHGFRKCDTTTLWVLAGQGKTRSLVSFMYPSPDGQCMDKVSCRKDESKLQVGSCSHCGANKWMIKEGHSGVMVMEKEKYCVVRKFNVAETHPCAWGYTGFQVVETSIHDVGFMLQSSAGMCLDGRGFRPCHLDDPQLYWGAQVRMVSGGATYSFYKFNLKQTSCLGKKKGLLAMVECDDATSKGWALMDNKLTTDKGKTCVSMDKTTRNAKLVPCKEGNVTPMTWSVRGR